LACNNIAVADEIEMTADELVSALTILAATETVCVLDSCGVSHQGSHLLIAGIEPIEVREIYDEDEDADKTLRLLDDAFAGGLAAFFTISYDLGLKLLGIRPCVERVSRSFEPDLFLARFEALIIHDYDRDATKFVGNPKRFDSIRVKLKSDAARREHGSPETFSKVTSNFTRSEYLEAIGWIKERIRRGDTYQTNLTQQLTATLSGGMTPAIIFQRLRRDHPAPFAAFIKRLDSTVVSASPERFFSAHLDGHSITTSPIKGTRPRGATPSEDEELRIALIESTKDRAENTMIVDLLRNDLGRVCEYNSVRVERLCDLEEHPTLFHLVSTITGDLRPDVKPSDILRAVFPCGSITGAPKLSTMRIIDQIEPTNRGLSMGAIGCYVPNNGFGMPGILDTSVAIRTMVILEGTATFNVGGGIVIDSDPDSEYQESLTKARALLAALGGRFESRP
jgi:para-aminobenzoate synthetase component 1